MNKDVIYIDVEDDITAIIGKVKASKEKIVALVPPKRVGVLQSAVNLRLLSRAAENNGKRLVLITNNQALVALAAAASMPIAKNLQSKPEIAEIPALEIDDGDDVINGADLPIGEHAKTAVASSSVAAAIDGAIKEDSVSNFAAPPKPGEVAKPRVKSGKVPNFSKFRKKIFLFGGLGVLLIGFLVWAIFFAGRATIVIAAKTTNASVNANVALISSGQTDADTATVRSVSEEIKKDDTIEFDATGKKDVGEKATGTVRFSTNSIDRLGTVIPAGTVLTTSANQTFTTDASVTLTLSNYNGATVSVTASGSGSSFNGATGAVSGAPNGINASIPNATAGGTDKQVTVVTAADVQKATEQLAQQNNDATKQELTDKFGDDIVVIGESFIANTGTPQSAPGVDQELTSGKAKLTRTTTYKMYGIEKDQLETYLKNNLEDQLQGDTNQRIYKNGIDEVKFSNFTTAQDATRVTIVTTGQVGPQIDENRIKEQSKGKRYGEIQQSIESIQGVDNVDVKFWPFWVRTTPNDINRISVEFQLNESE